MIPTLQLGGMGRPVKRLLSGAVSFVAATGGGYVTATSINSPSSPLGIANGDALFALVFGRSALTAPAGWSLVASQTNVGLTTQTLYVYRKNTVTTSDANTAFTWTQAASGRMGLAYIVARSSTGNVATAASSSVETDYTSATAYPQNVSIPALTATQDGELFLIAATVESVGTFGTWTAASGDTLRTTAAQTDNRLIGATRARNSGQSNSTPMTNGTTEDVAIANYYSAITVRLQAA